MKRKPRVASSENVTEGRPRGPLARRYDHGRLTLALFKPLEGDRGIASIAAGTTAESDFGGDLPGTKPFSTKLTGALVRTMKLDPGQEASAEFAITWHFPNHSLPGTRLPADLGRHYATPHCAGLQRTPNLLTRLAI